MLWLDLEDVGLAEGEDGRGRAGRGGGVRGLWRWGWRGVLRSWEGGWLCIIVCLLLLIVIFVACDGISFLSSFPLPCLISLVGFPTLIPTAPVPPNLPFTFSTHLPTYLTNLTPHPTPQKPPKKQPHAWRCFRRRLRPQTIRIVISPTPSTSTDINIERRNARSGEDHRDGGGIDFYFGSWAYTISAYISPQASSSFLGFIAFSGWLIA